MTQDSSDLPKGFTATLRASDKGGVMVIEWDGDEEARPIWMGTDELLTLTPEETALRNAMIEKMQHVVPKDTAPETAPETAPATTAASKYATRIQAASLAALACLFIAATQMDDPRGNPIYIALCLIVSLGFSVWAFFTLYRKQSDRG